MMALGIGPLLWWLIRKVRQDTARDHSGWRRPAASSSSGWLVTALGVVVIAGLLTFSRAGFAAMVVAATLCVGVFAAAGWIDRRVKVAMAVLGVFLAVALATNGYQPLANRLATVVGASSLEEMSAGRQQIWSAAGKRLHKLKVPESPTNCTFGGPKRDTLYVTARTSLYRLKTKMRGVSARPEKPPADSKPAVSRPAAARGGP